MSTSDIVYWLALQEKNWIMPLSKIEQIFNQYYSLEPLWRADAHYLLSLGIDEKSVSSFLRYKNSLRLERFERLIKVLEKNNVRILRYVDKEYPAPLKDLGKAYEGPPLVLLHKGCLFAFDNCVAIVGTRESSHYGHMMARKLARTIAKNGYTIVSGLARGIDTEAHCGALEAPNGRTIAVLAWMHPIYPPENVELAKDIIARGAIISERFFRPDTKFKKMTPGKFVERNRIISGISHCVIAVESGKEGGTVHQVRIALSQGRKVFALKPKRTNKRAKEGYKLFIDMGATPINSAKPVLDFLKKTLTKTAFREKTIDSYSQRSILAFDKG